MSSESSQDLQARDTPGVIAPPPLIYLASLALGFALETLLIAREERYLEWKFGAEYEDYKRQVRRWL